VKKRTELTIPPEKIFDDNYIKYIACQKLGVLPADISSIQYLKRSIDARHKPVYRLLIDIYIGETPSAERPKYIYHPVRENKKVIIVGFGPGGMFAALRLIELGIKPVIVDRGKDVRTRRKDLRNLQQHHIVNPDSNYCFGEGGAGAYSDGKLYTRSVKRGNVKKILEVLVQHGTADDILIDAHPHIGSNKLPKVVTEIRNTILNCGGEIHFESKVTDLIIKQNKILGVIVNEKEEIFGDAVILATGHSARDIYYLLNDKGIRIEQKPFAMGVRIEHPQSLINEIQYHTDEITENLPAASYNISCSINERGVYSFCMCPGGLIVPSATSPGELVVNGMSLSRRDSPFANSGLVVEVTENEWKKYFEEKPFSGLHLQQEVEQLAFKLANNTQSAPSQRVTDFVEGKLSQTLPKSSYIPGLTSARLDEALPGFMVERIKKSLSVFNKKMKGYYTEDAVLVAAETRTSSPVRIPRDKAMFMNDDLNGLFPCGEGAGYAGGIVSSAIDGENCADAVNKYLDEN